MGPRVLRFLNLYGTHSRRCKGFIRNHSCIVNAEVQPSTSARKQVPNDGLGLGHFIANVRKQRHSKIIPTIEESSAYLTPQDLCGDGRKVKYVTYGCQMNVNDVEIVRALLRANHYVETEELHNADVVVLMTCSIREGAEDKVWRELKRIRKYATRNQTVGVLGCMAERVRHGLLSQKDLVDVVAGPDSYRDLPRLLAVARAGSSAINVQLSVEETYADVAPVRVDRDAKSAFVSIMRGCDNMCTYCVVPLTRGRERSRPIDSIIEEVRRLSQEGVKQVTLLGQNVNSYRDMSESSYVIGDIASSSSVPGFSTVYKPKIGGRTFVTLLEKVADVDPEMRIRFTSPHPKDFPMEVLQLIRDRSNICNQLHMPAQSGDDTTLERMGRGYTRDTYLRLVDDVRLILPGVFITSDFIAGFCGETEEAHQRTLDLMRAVKYSFCYVFPYSMREKTRAHYRLIDDVPNDVKKRRHSELAAVFREEALALHESLVGTTQVVLVEGASKRSNEDVQGRADGGSRAIFKNDNNYLPGEYVKVKVNKCSSQTFHGIPLSRTTLRTL